MKEAMFYEKKGENVKCGLCRHQCLIANGKRGICGIRQNTNGKLQTLVYGKTIAAHVDPIEKKPFFHFLPGTSSFSIATAGCNLRCQHCQNWEISQGAGKLEGIPGDGMPPEEVVRLAKQYDCKSISYTYTEPTVFFEYAYDTAQLAKREGLCNTFVTNGYMSKEALETIAPYLDAANVDIKGFTEKFYREVCGARLAPVLENVKRMKELGIWVEITTLVIPTLNDSKKGLKGIAQFIADVDPHIPWHVSAFHPDYKLVSLPSTPRKTIEKAVDIGYGAGLKYVYGGNIPGVGENTYCYKCKTPLITRYVFNVMENNVMDSKCPKCGAEIHGVGL